MGMRVLVRPVPMIVVVHELLRHVGEHFARGERASARPFHAAPLSSGRERSSHDSVDGSRATSNRCASAASTSLRMRRPSHPSQSAASSDSRRASCASGRQRRPLHGQLAERVLENAADRVPIRQGEAHHEIGARQERLVYGVDEIGCRHEQHGRKVLRNLVDAEQDRVGGAMDIDRIGFEGCRRNGAPRSSPPRQSVPR